MHWDRNEVRRIPSFLVRRLLWICFLNSLLDNFFYKQFGCLPFWMFLRFGATLEVGVGRSSEKDLDRIVVSVESARRSCFGIETSVKRIFIVGSIQ